MITGFRIPKNVGYSGKFGEWLFFKIKELGYTQTSFGKLVGISREQISNQIHQKCKPNRTSVVAYCYYTGDNPEEIWKLVEEDWG